MSVPKPATKVFLSFASSDLKRAGEMEQLLKNAGAEVVSPAKELSVGATVVDEIIAAIAKADVVFVLIGPKTRGSRWVDWEIETATRNSPSSPPAALVAVILPEHDDYSKPFYDPEDVPLRVHDHVSRESALLRKWPKKDDEVQAWIAEAIRRRERFPAPFLNFSTQSALSAFPWEDEGNAPVSAPELKP